VLIIFIDIPEIQGVNIKLKRDKKFSGGFQQSELEEELQRKREEIKNTLEEMQTSQEELKTTNEELQSTNEELQSTNEELTTSKEEMQSLNEELQTVNAELQSKVDEFSRVNNDMKNLLNSTDIATLFLDKDLNIRRYTNQATKIIKLIKSDIGRPFTDLVSDLIYPELADDSREVLNTLVFIQKQIPTKDGRWFSIRIMPYRTFDDRIDGLVITFINMSDLKQLEVELNETMQMQRLLLSTSIDIIIRLSSDLKILEFNPEAEKFFGLKRDKVIGQNYLQLFVPSALRKATEKGLNKMLNNAKNGNFKIDVIDTRGNIQVIDWSVNILINNLKLPAGMIIITKNRDYKNMNKP
jgi:two-component system CheB/CheR fusion protein